MKISYIKPGKIKIADKKYEEDVVVDSSGIVFSWKKKKKILGKDDLEIFLKEEPEALIVAKNENLTEISEEGKRLIKNRDVLLFFDKTAQAVKAFNLSARKKRRVMAVFALKSDNEEKK